MNYPEQYKTRKSMQILGVEIDDMQTEVLNEISLYLFDNSLSSIGKKTFDLLQDYEYYYPDFLQYGIDLNTDEISWWKFNSILGAIFFKRRNSVLKFVGKENEKKTLTILI